MRRRGFHFGSVSLCLAIALGLFAQEGHPLTGTWVGDWGPTPSQRNHITLVMEWNGDKVTGILNPGPESSTLESVFVDVTSWRVRIDADGKDQSGRPVHISAEGKLEDLGSAHRKIIGTWSQDAIKGDFKIARE